MTTPELWPPLPDPYTEDIAFHVTDFGDRVYKIRAATYQSIA